MLVATVAFALATSTYPMPPVVSDALGYTWSARTLVSLQTYNHAYSESPEPDAMVMPGYPLFLATLYALGPRGVDLDDAVRAVHPHLLTVQLALAVATVGLIAACGIALGGTLLGAIAGLMAAIYLPLAWTSSVALTETLAVFLVSLQLLLAINILRRHLPPSARSFLILGATTGLVVLVRPIYLPWLAMPLILFALQKRVVAKDLARLTALCLLGLVLVLAPWWIRNAIDFHRFIPLTAEWEGKRLGMASAMLESENPSLTAEEQTTLEQAEAAGRDGKAAVVAMRYRRSLVTDPVGFVAKRLGKAWIVVRNPYAAPVDAFVLQRDAPAAASVSQGVNFGPPPEKLSPELRLSADAMVTYQQVLVVLALFGLLFVWRRPGILLVASFVVYSIVVYAAILFFPRYFLPSMPAVILLAATAIAGTVSTVRSQIARRRAAAALPHLGP